MDLFWEAFREAWRLLSTGDGDVYGITARTAAITGTSTAVSMLIGIPSGLGLALGRFPGQRTLVAFANAGTGMPPVVAGLFVSMLLWRSGLFGGLRLIYTPTAIVFAQTIIATPVIAAITAAAVMALPPSLHLQIRAMGAGRLQYLWLVAREARLPILVAVMAGFGAVISEVGASMMVGGNLAGETRVLTTAAVLEVSKGSFGTALAFGLILVAVTVAVSLALTAVQQSARRR
ncbi:MAG: ABC transporter permease [Chloroflexi bacterium]|nr:ABC transporter permease [Chloroflexota bacterium]MDA1004342.1 ABC transporter permease [Chloroflexota bacterium]